MACLVLGLRYILQCLPSLPFLGSPLLLWGLIVIFTLTGVIVNQDTCHGHFWEGSRLGELRWEDPSWVCVVPFHFCFPRAGINGVHYKLAKWFFFSFFRLSPRSCFDRCTATTIPGPVANMLPPFLVRILSVLPNRITLVLWSQVRIYFKEALLQPSAVWVMNEVMPISVFGILIFQAVCHRPVCSRYSWPCFSISVTFYKQMY